MNEAWVKNIVRTILDIYEKDTGAPRHLTNSNRLDAIETKLDKVDGGITAIKWIGGVLGFALLVMQLLRLVQNRPIH